MGVLAKIRSIRYRENPTRHTAYSAEAGRALGKVGSWDGNLKWVVAEDYEKACAKLLKDAQQHIAMIIKRKDANLQLEDFAFTVYYTQVDEEGYTWGRPDTDKLETYSLADGRVLPYRI